MLAILARQDQKHQQTTMVTRQLLIAKVLMYLLIVLSAWILGRLVWNIFSSSQELVQWKPVIQSNQQLQQTQVTDKILSLEKSQLFGTYTSGAAVSQKNVPETKLNLTLVGVVASSSPKSSLAVIANRGQQATYGVDEKIEGTSASLVSVLPDRVIISNRGNEETLMLEGLDYKRINSQPMEVSREVANEAQVNTPMLTETNLDQIRTEILENPQKIFQYIRLSQRMVDGELQGYQVRPGKDRVLFDSVGLKDGDIAVEMNGTDLTNATEMLTLWQDVAEADAWDLTVERDGQRHQIQINFE